MSHVDSSRVQPLAAERRDGADAEYLQQARQSLERTIAKLRGCSDEEKQRLHRDLVQLQQMMDKLERGRVEIAVFGEISTGKSALINALVGQAVAAVDVRGGWTKEVWGVPWSGSGHRVAGLAQSEVVLVDTPGLNEVGGAERSEMAREAAQKADLILFVTDSDLNETEFQALTTLAAAHKPILVCLNKCDLYTPQQQQRLLDVLRHERLADLVPPENVIPTIADPREVQRIIQRADGSEQHEGYKPQPDVAELKARILEVLERDGLALLALNAALYAADKSDRIAALRVQLRARQAQQTILSCAATKAVAVALNPLPALDLFGGAAVDVLMVLSLARVYGLEMSVVHARELVTTIAQSAGLVMLSEWGTHLAATTFKLATFGYGTLLTAIPQGAAAGFGSYIVGRAAQFYFEHGSSWGGQSPKAVVRRILNETDKTSVLLHLKDQIKQALQRNPHAERPS